MVETPTKEDFSQRINELLGRIAQGKPLAELEATLSEAQKFMDENPDEKPALDYVIREALGDWIAQKDEIAQKEKAKNDNPAQKEAQKINSMVTYLKQAIENGVLDKNGSLAEYLNTVKCENADIRTVMEKYNVTANDVKLGFLKARCFGPVMYNVENMLLAHYVEDLFDDESQVGINVNGSKATFAKGDKNREVDLELKSGGMADLRQMLHYIQTNNSTEAWANSYAQRIFALDGIISQLEKISEGNRPAGTLKAYHVSIVNATYAALKQLIADKREDREKELLKDNLQEIALAFEGLVHSYAKKIGDEEESVKDLIELRKEYDGKIAKQTASIETESDKLYDAAENAAYQSEGDLKERGKAYVKAVVDYVQFTKAYSRVLEENENTLLSVVEQFDSIAAGSNIEIEHRKEAVFNGAKFWGITKLDGRLGEFFSK